jgi:hypothetical protein
LAGVSANFFTVAGTSSMATNDANSGVITAVFPETGAAPASSNANLISLSVNKGTLSPAFNANTIFYTVNVDNKDDKINVNAKAADNKAKVTGDGQRSLVVGENTIVVMVTAQDATVKFYTILVVRAAGNNSGGGSSGGNGNAGLTSLTVNKGSLSPAFNTNITEYMVSVAYDVAKINVNAKAADNKAKVTGDGQNSLAVGDNVIEVKVVAQDGTEQIYTITVTRAGLDALVAYPNPSSDQVTIGALSGKGTLTMFDIYGRPVINRNVTSTDEKISVSSLPQGSYIVQVTEGNTVRTVQVIVE